MTAQDPTRTQGPEEDDAFLRAVLRTVQWAQENSRTVTIGAVVAVLVFAAGLYYQNYRQDVRQQAAGQLQTLQAQLQQGQAPPDTLARSLRDFVSQYGDTRYGDEGRLLLGRLQLNQNRWEAGISSLQPVRGEYPPDSPTGYAARKLLAAAHEGAGNTERALSLYAELADGAQFPFQRNEAAADRARLLAGEGRLQEAEDIYSRLVQQADTTAAGVAGADLQRYRVRLGEVRGRLAAGDTGSVEVPGSAEASPAPADTGAGSARGG